MIESRQKYAVTYSLHTDPPELQKAIAIDERFETFEEAQAFALRRTARDAKELYLLRRDPDGSRIIMPFLGYEQQALLVRWIEERERALAAE